MPELPEVETVARDLRGAVTGRRIEGVTVIRPDVVRYPDGAMLPALLTGQRFGQVERHGKYLLLGLDSGDDLMVHLGMTGHLLVCDAGRAGAEAHAHPRRRSTMGASFASTMRGVSGGWHTGRARRSTAARVLPRLGVEPLSDALLAGRASTRCSSARRGP